MNSARPSLRPICLLAALSFACQGASSPAEHWIEGGSEVVTVRIEDDAVVLWGGWHRVPFDPGVGSTLRRALGAVAAERPEEAIGAINEGLTNKPRSAALLEARGALYAELGFPRAARGDFERVTVLAPERASGWVGLGWVCETLDLPHDALEAVSEATRLGDESPELDLIAARALRRLGRSGPGDISAVRSGGTR